MTLKPKALLGAVPSTAWRFLLSRRQFPLLRTFLLGQEWAYDACRFAGTREFHVLFDVGAHRGETALYLHGFFPRAQIHAFEFVPDTARQLADNVRSKPNIRVHVQALGAATEQIRVNLQGYSQGNSLRHATAAAAGALTVDVTTIDAFCAAQGIERIDLLKTDTEGSDLQVLQGAAGMIARGKIPFIFCEVDFDGSGDHQAFGPLNDFLTHHGYQLCGFYEQFMHQARLVFCNALYFNPGAWADRPSR